MQILENLKRRKVLKVIGRMYGNFRKSKMKKVKYCVNCGWFKISGPFSPLERPFGICRLKDRRRFTEYYCTAWAPISTVYIEIQKALKAFNSLRKRKHLSLKVLQFWNRAYRDTEALLDYIFIHQLDEVKKRYGNQSV